MPERPQATPRPDDIRTCPHRRIGGPI
jgi:hypothetical protein